MEIVLQYVDSCPNWERTAALLTRLVDEGLDATIALELIGTHDEAMRRGFRGSPTVLINGSDPFADEDAPEGLACRVYQTEAGLAGSPSFDQLRQAVGMAKAAADPP